MKKEYTGLKILVLDIETSPLVSYTWGLFDQNIALNQIESEWSVLSWSAKYYTDKSGVTYGPHNKIMYQDQRNEKDIRNDKKLLQGIWDLLNDSDITLTQNGVAFDLKKLNARFIMNGMKPPSPHKNIDTLKIAKKHFAFTSNKLEWMTKKLCTKNKKMKTKKFQGFDLWKECLAGNQDAFKEMQAYNEMDVLSLEELYHHLSPWDSTLNFSLYSDDTDIKCNCGTTKIQKRGFHYTKVGKYQKFTCLSCGSWFTGKLNLLTKSKKKSLLTKI
jgi:hypothetical protein